MFSRISIYSLFILFIVTIYSCDIFNRSGRSTTVVVDDDPNWQTYPEGAVNRLFVTAERNNISMLEGICDTVEPVDDNIKRLCSTTDLEKSGFKKYFIGGRITEVRYIEDNRVEVDIVAGDGNDALDLVRLVKRGDLWFFYEYWYN